MCHRPLFAALDVDDVPGLSSPLNYRVQKHYLQLAFKFASMNHLFVALCFHLIKRSLRPMGRIYHLLGPSTSWGESVGFATN